MHTIILIDIMDQIVNLKEVVNSIVNGTFGRDNCLICLTELTANSEGIFTKISNRDEFSSTADMLEICGIKLPLTDSCKICSSCYKLASATYLFYSLSQQSQSFINFYLNELEKQISAANISETSQSMSIILPNHPRAFMGSYDVTLLDIHESDQFIKQENTHVKNHIKSEVINECDESEDIIIITNENGKSQFYKEENGSLSALQVDYESKIFNDDQIPKMKRRRKRKPMIYKACSHCPIQYRFLGKLKEHMKLEHGIELHVCKICKAFTEDEQEYERHLQTHGDVHICDKCNMVFKRRLAIINHLKWHEDVKNMTTSDQAYICEMCGLVLQDDEHLQEHYEKKHVKKYTCYYCGRMYKGELSFEMHIQKHESVINKEDKQERPKKTKRKRCTQCNKDFVDDRSLMWHKRLHSNERPYICKVCGRGFVTLNRRNQHAVCAHTAPARRCPLCPALFHLRSMVNTHIKKVHLNTNKRRSRCSKYQNVYWKTETVPIEELSVSIQDKLLELQAKKKVKTMEL